MGTVVNVLFGVLAVATGALFLINVVLVTLKLTHHSDQAKRISDATAPWVSFFRLGGRGAGGSKHA